MIPEEVCLKRAKVTISVSFGANLLRFEPVEPKVLKLPLKVHHTNTHRHTAAVFRFHQGKWVSFKQYKNCFKQVFFFQEKIKKTNLFAFCAYFSLSLLPFLWFQAFDAFIYIFFALEMVIKMVALGIFGRRCYLGDTWNRLDFFIVMAG